MDTISRNLITPLFILLLITGLPIHAASITHDLNYSNGFLSPTPFGNVIIEDSGADILFTVNIFSSAYPAQTGNFGMDKFLFNFDPQTLNVASANIQDINPTWSISTTQQGSNLGSFEFLLAGTGNSRTERLTFKIENVIGDDISSYAVVGNGGHRFAAHVSGSSGSNTWISDAPSPVPVPAAVWMFGSGLVALLGVRRRRK